MASGVLLQSVRRAHLRARAARIVRATACGAVAALALSTAGPAHAAPVTAPVVTIDPASNITSGTATLTGTVDPVEPTALSYFEFGLSTDYGRTTTEEHLNGPGAQPVTASIGFLTPSTTYHYRLVAANGTGTTRTDDATFTTLPAVKPTVTPTPIPGTGPPTPTPPPTPTIAPPLPAVLIGNGGATGAPTVTPANSKKRPIVRVPITCKSGASCVGTLLLVVPRKVTIADSRTSIVAATAAFNIPSATRVTFAMTITKGTRKLIARAKRESDPITLAITLAGQPTASHIIALTTKQD